MAVTDKISALVKDQFPDFYKEEGENFLAFIQAYYEYLEQNGKMTDAIRSLESYKDIATTTDDFIAYFINQFLPGIPLNVTADKKLLVKYINQGNQARGTLSAYKLLFRALYNEDIEVVFPADQILKVSDGDWNIDRYLVTPYDPNNYAFIGQTIKGTESESEALIEDITRRVVKGRDLMQIIVSNVRGTFNHLEPVRLKGDIGGTGHAPIVEAGISSIDILSPGGEYAPGDTLELLSSLNGDFGKVVVTSTEDLGGTLTFSLVNGGSGYTPSTDPDGTTIEFIGGDGVEPASFQIGQSDIVDTFALSINLETVASNTLFGASAPTVTGAKGGDNQTLSTFANMVLSSPDYGFRDGTEIYENAKDFRDHSNAVLVIANTSDPSITQDAKLYGVTSGANATVTEVQRAYDSTDVVLRINGYKNFSVSEKVNITTSTGTTVGTVSQFSGNTIGYHVAQIGWIANTDLSPLLEGDEIVGRTSGAFGVVKKIVDLTANGYTRGVGGADDRDLYTVQVTANNTANLTTQFDTGPMKRFIEDEGLRLVGANTTVGNVVFTTSNSQIENIYTRLSDALNFDNPAFGTIASISLPVGGSGFSIAPRIRVTDADISSLGIGEVVLTLQSDDPNWGTGNPAFTKLDTTDRVVQGRAVGDVKGTGTPNQAIGVTQYANGTYEMEVRLFQKFLQREPGNINFANNQSVTLQIVSGDYLPGTPDNREEDYEGTAKVVSLEDRGILGRNAVINAGVGADGTITGLRVLDSGFSYLDREVVIVERTTRPDATSATVRVNLSGVANAEGYYASTRSHISSARGYLQDGEFYQEFSYQVQSPLSLDRYRDIALELVHPAGQALFGQFRLQSNAEVDVITTANNFIRAQSNGTVSIAKTAATGTVSITANKKVVTGSGTNFTGQFGSGVANNVIIEVDKGDGIDNIFVETTFTTNTTTNAILSDDWIFGTISSANIYYANSNIMTGSSTNLAAEYANGDTIILQTSDGLTVTAQINTVRTNTEATLDRNWTLADLSSANAYYTQGNIS